MITQLDNGTVALLVVAGVLAAAGLLAALAVKISRFRRELRYLDREIGRTEGTERSYWQRKKRQLWLSLLPFRRR